MIDFIYRFASEQEAQAALSIGGIMQGWQVHFITQRAEYDEDGNETTPQAELEDVFWLLSVSTDDEDGLVAARQRAGFMSMSDRPDWIMNGLTQTEQAQVLYFEPVAA